MLNLILDMFETAVSPWHGFLQNMAYVMMNHLLKAGPTNLQVNNGYSVHLVSVVLIR